MNSLCIDWIASTTHFEVCTNEAIYKGLDAINDLKIITFLSSVRFLIFPVFMMALIFTSRAERFLSLDKVLSKLKWIPSILIEPVTSEINVQFPGLSLLYFDLPNKHTSHFSMFTLKLENNSKFATSFRILLKDCLSLTKKLYH